MMTEVCPVCGKRCDAIYRADGGWGVAVGCNHCYTPPNARRCPVCGEFCVIIYRRNRYGDIVGCENCVDEFDAAQDADTHPDDYNKETENGW